jgi:hypothetical protein
MMEVGNYKKYENKKTEKTTNDLLNTVFWRLTPPWRVAQISYFSNDFCFLEIPPSGIRGDYFT